MSSTFLQRKTILINKTDFSNNQTFCCVNKTYLDFITEFITVIDTLCPSEKN